MNVTIEKQELVIRIPLSAPRPSASGKTLVIASTNGNMRTDAKEPTTGRQITIGLNAYIAKE